MGQVKSLSISAICAALLVGTPLASQAAVPVQFDPTGAGGAGAISVGSFDWSVGSALAVKGNPAGGLAVNNTIQVLAQASLATVRTPDGQTLAPPANKEFTFVAGFGERVVSCTGTPCSNASFAFDPAQASWFEIWVKDLPGDPAADYLAGTGFNTAIRIMYGTVSEASGNFAVAGSCPNNSNLFDQSANGNQWGNQLTLCGSGATQISVQVTYISDQYFPGFTPAQVDSLKLKFNTSTITPFLQEDPSRQFVGNSAGSTGSDPQSFVAPILGAVNGQAGTATLDFEFQADGNHAFEVGETVPGACRVTY